MKHILISGGSRGIGAALVKGLAADGHRVAFLYRNNRAAAERLIKFGFTNITANDPHDLIAYLDEIGRRVGK